MRKASYPVAHSAVMQAREQSQDLADKIQRGEDKLVATYGGGRKSAGAEKKARAPVDAMWNQYKEVLKRLSYYEKIRVRLEQKKRKPQPLTKKPKRRERVSKLPTKARSWGATGEGVRHGFAVLVTRRASEKPRSRTNARRRAGGANRKWMWTSASSTSRIPEPQECWMRCWRLMKNGRW